MKPGDLGREKRAEATPAQTKGGWIIPRGYVQESEATFQQSEQATNLEFFWVQLIVPRQIRPNLSRKRQHQEKEQGQVKQSRMFIKDDLKDRKPELRNQRKDKDL